MLNLQMANLLNKNSKIAVTSRSFSKNQVLVSTLRSKFKHVKLNTEGLSLKGKSLIEFLDGMDAAIIGIEPITHQVISKLPALKLISKYGVGTNNLDMSAIQKNNITLSLSPGSNSQSVAEYALYLILLSLRQNFNNLEEISRSIWSQKKGRELYKKKIGIIGYGNIGKKLTAMLKPFRTQILIFDKRKISFNQTQQSFIKQVTFKKLLKESEIISVNIPFLNETHNLIAKEEFNHMREDVIIINTSRGGIVNEEDLYKFLKKNESAFGAFDVFRKEPNFKSNLYTLSNFFGSSHRASLTNEGIYNMGMAAIDGLLKN